MAVQTTAKPKTTRTGAGTFTIGEASALTTFDGQVTAITLEPDVDTGDSLEVLSGAKVSGDRTEEWKITGELISDFGQANSLIEFCFTNRGKEMPFRFTPNRTGSKVITGSLIVEAVAIGGDVGETGKSEFEFLLVGAPILEQSAS